MLKPDYCYKSHCPLSKIGASFSIPDGKGTSGVGVIGEALGGDEAIDGLPFRPHAQAGSKLEEAFRLATTSDMIINREMFLIWNIVACQPPGNNLEYMWYENRAIECCRKHFDDVIEYSGIFPPNRIRTLLALGNVPLKHLTKYSGVAKQKQSIYYLRGYVLESKYGPLVPSFHPSFLRRGAPHFTPALVDDLKKAIRVANGKLNNYYNGGGFYKPKYNEHPSLEDVEGFYQLCKQNRNLPISCDIETPTSNSIDEDEREGFEEAEIIQVQFSCKKRTGIAIPWKEPYLSWIFKIFALPNDKLGFNWWNFDGPRIKAKGIDVSGRVHDLMWMWKHYYPRLQRGLQNVASFFDFPFPWKHMFGENLQWYGCADVDAPLWIYEKLPGLMEERGVWKGYVDSVYRVHLILDRARDVGVPVNEERRIELERTLAIRREKLDEELQRDIPDCIKNLQPRRKNKKTGEVTYGYIREPKEVKEAKQAYRKAKRVLEGRGKRVAPFYVFIRKRYGLVKREFEEIDSETGEIRKAARWCKLVKFKASKDQLVRYLKWKQSELLKDPKGRVKND